MNSAENLDLLIDGYLDGTLDAEGMARLDALVKGDAGAAEKLAQALRLHTDLRDFAREASEELTDTHKASAETVQAIIADRSPVTSHQRLSAVKKAHRGTRRIVRPAQDQWIPMASAAALLLLCFGLWVFLGSNRTTTTAKPTRVEPVPVVQNEKPVTPAPRVPPDAVVQQKPFVTPKVESPIQPEVMTTPDTDVMAGVRRESLARIEAQRRKEAELAATQLTPPETTQTPKNPVNTERPVLAEVISVDVAQAGKDVPMLTRGSAYEAPREPLKQGTKLYLEDVIESGRGQVTLAYTGENTRLDIKTHSMVRLFKKNGELSKHVSLEHGSLSAQVDKQPAGQALWFSTPQAESMVLGTQLTLTVTRESTRLDVKEGKVRMTRLSDKSSVDVAAGESATATNPLVAIAAGAIFNGKDLDGWTTTRGQWTVENGLVVGQDPKGGSSRIESRKSYKNYELTCQIRVLNASLGEVQINSYAYFFQLEWLQAKWTEIKVTVQGDTATATQDGKKIEKEHGDGKGGAPSGPVAFFVTRGGRMEIKDARIRELP